MYKIFKRYMDILCALILLVLLSPIMLLIACLIILDGGKAIFIQERTGKDSKVFNLYKFRSMSVNNDVRDFKCNNEITKIGAIIRRFSLDELPQLVNILKGEMSFIGPRPWIEDYTVNFTNNQRRRLEVLPGITGLAQCSGRNTLSVKEKIDLDIIYVDNVSLSMDIYVLVNTIKTIFIKTGTSITKLGIKEEILELQENQLHYTATLYVVNVSGDQKNISIIN